jgi:hypothetical protein
MTPITAPPTLRVSLFTVIPAAAWTTDDGYAVARVDAGGMRGYWVRDKTDRWSLHNTLAEVDEDLAWLRANNR